MPRYKLRYGTSEITAEIPSGNYVGEIAEKKHAENAEGSELIMRALASPTGSKRLGDIVSPGEKTVIITSDISRPTPSSTMLPPVIEELGRGGLSEKDISVVLALGTHRHHTEAEKRIITGDGIFESGIKIMDSDMDDCIRLGECRHGTPVDIFRPVAEADRIICLGNIEYHYYAGYSGGCKAVFPGVSSLDAIRKNHSHMMDPGAGMGRIGGNPVREDIDEAGRTAGIDFILNVILDENGDIMAAVAGDCIKAHRRGCEILDSFRKVSVEAQADIVIVSPGGYPKDINLYQSHKALESTKGLVRPGGVIIWCAKAAEGIGNKVFAEWLLNMTYEEMKAELDKNFTLGGHLAYYIAEILQTKDIYLVSDIPVDVSVKQDIKRFPSADEALTAAFEKCGRDSKIMTVPAGNSIFPVIRNDF